MANRFLSVEIRSRCRLTGQSWAVEVAFKLDDETCESGEWIVEEATLEMLLEPPKESDLLWYFKDQIAQPFLQNTRAARVSQQLKEYGLKLCNDVFPEGSLRRQILEEFFRENTDSLPSAICVVGPPEFQMIRWETMTWSAGAAPLALRTRFWRKSDSGFQDQSLLSQLSSFRISSQKLNILLVTARARGKSDIGYRTISRLLSHALEPHKDKYCLTLLRPGTFKKLQIELIRRGPGYYQLIHFDTHGLVLDADTYELLTSMPEVNCSKEATFNGNNPLAFLEFQAERSQNLGAREATKDFVPSTALGKLLCEYQVKLAVLNACDSASASASLIGQLHSSGIQHVLGLSHAITEDAAAVMVTSFYSALIDGVSFATAVASVRGKLFENRNRRAFYGANILLEDWILPIVHQDFDWSISFENLEETSKGFPAESNPPPITTKDEANVQTDGDVSHRDATVHYKYAQVLNSGTFLGRDFEILQIEQGLIEERNSILLRGLGGTGKSSLIQHLCIWWTQTGFCNSAFYYEFASHVWTLPELLADMGRNMFIPELLFQTKPLVQQIKLIHEAARSQSFVLALDNLEVILQPLDDGEGWNKDEQRKFRRFLAGFRQSSSFVVLGSRGEERWLSAEVFEDNEFLLGGLDKSAASTMIGNILESFDKLEYLSDSGLSTLDSIAQHLDRHPLALQTVVSSVRRSTPAEILEHLQANNIQIESQDDLDRCVSYSFQNLDPYLKRKIYELLPWGSHVIINDLEMYSHLLVRILQSSSTTNPDDQDQISWDHAIKELRKAGLAALVHEHSGFVILHPHLIRYLAKQFPQILDEFSGSTIENCQEALRQCKRQKALYCAKYFDLDARFPTLEQVLKDVEFTLESFRLALKLEIDRLNSNETSQSPLIWSLIIAYFSSTANYQEWLAFCQAAIDLIDPRSPSTVIFHSEVLNSIAKVQSNLEDMSSALTTSKREFELVTSASIILQNTDQEGPDEIVVQKVQTDHKSLALARSKCFEQLSSIATSSGNQHLGIRCLYLSLAWRRTAGMERRILRDLERGSVGYLARLLLALVDKEKALIYQRSAILRALEVGMFPNAVSTLVIQQPVSSFDDDELSIVELLVRTTKEFCIGRTSDFDLFSADIFLLDLAIRKDEESKVLAQAELAIATLKAKKSAAHEANLYFKLGQWHAGRSDLEEALNFFLKAYAMVEVGGEFGYLVISGSILAGLVDVEKKLGRETKSIEYDRILRENFEKSQAITVEKIREEKRVPSAFSTPDGAFWKTVEEKVGNDHEMLRPTLAQFEEEVKADGARLDEVMSDRKGFYTWLYTSISIISTLEDSESGPATAS